MPEVAPLKRNLSRTFITLKHLIYAVVVLECIYYFAEDTYVAASLGSTVDSFASFIQIYSASIDGGGWLLILLLFEIETFWMSDATALGSTGQRLRRFRLLLFAIPIVAFGGYFLEFLSLYDVSLLDLSPCDLIDEDMLVMSYLDVFEPLTLENCRDQSGWYQLGNSDSVITAGTGLANAREFMVSEVLNAGGWVFVFLLLQLETRGLFTRSENFGRLRRVVWVTKFLAYTSIFGALFYWYVIDEAVSFLEEIFWLLAFFCIENNVTARRRNLMGSSLTAQ